MHYRITFLHRDDTPVNDGHQSDVRLWIDLLSEVELSLLCSGRRDTRVFGTEVPIDHEDLEVKKWLTNGVTCTKFEIDVGPPYENMREGMRWHTVYTPHVGKFEVSLYDGWENKALHRSFHSSARLAMGASRGNIEILQAITFEECMFDGDDMEEHHEYTTEIGDSYAETLKKAKQRLAEIRK